MDTCIVPERTSSICGTRATPTAMSSSQCTVGMSSGLSPLIRQNDTWQRDDAYREV